MIFCTPIHLSLLEKNTDILISGADTESCLIFSLHARAEGCIPRICLEIRSEDGEQLYLSHDYAAAEPDVTEKEWRIPPLPKDGMQCIAHISVPDGGRLHILDYGARRAAGYERGSDALRFHAHLGFFGVAPQNTIPAFLYAAKCGFEGCIANARKTADGIFVCMHDETINHTARDLEGNEPKAPMKIAEMTYEDLLEWDFGRWKHSCYEGTRIALLEDFFAICKASGMQPYISTDNYLTKDDWMKIRAMLTHHGLLENFRVKCNYADIEGLKTAFSVLGSDIDSYTLWHFYYEGDMIEKLHSIGFDESRTHGIIELLEMPEKPCFTKEIIAKIRKSGFIPSAVCCWGRKSGEYYRRLMDLGVSEFTEDHHLSFGLRF